MAVMKINEPHRVFKEFKGVITGSPAHTAWLYKSAQNIWDTNIYISGTA
jgi:hypothetical protein